jgi:hypothetical protein
MSFCIAGTTYTLLNDGSVAIFQPKDGLTTVQAVPVSFAVYSFDGYTDIRPLNII